MGAVTPPPSWTVTLVCGAAGVGKSSVATALARRYGTPLAEVDDIVTAVKALTTAEQLPLLHYWDTHPEAGSWAPGRIAELHLAVADMLRPALLAVIADHLDFRAPVVVEGDYLVPELASGFGCAVRAVIVDEPDEDRIVTNYRSREPHHGEQRGRARVSTLVGARLVERAARCRVPVVPARPWTDVLDRVDAALRG
jgi:2-phosphoglycerate kinase